MKRRFGLGLLIVAFTGMTTIGCGYSEDEWQAQLSKYNKLVQEKKDGDAAHARERAKLEKRIKKLDDKLAGAKKRAEQLEKDLKAAGLDISKLNKTLSKRGTEISKLNSVLEERQRALALYKRRAAQLERIKARFERLRNKLNALTNLGLAVKIRNNRMVISLPGDVLFESGQDRLKTKGKDVLDKVAGIINGDASLKKRQYQVAGHTDNIALRGGGLFQDNWGLSLMRARKVLLYIIDPSTGGLPANNWSAAGFADTDPIADNGSKQGRQSNRRCEIIVVPSAEEMFDLKAIAQ